MKTIKLFLVVITVLAISVSAFAATQTFNPIADTNTSKNNPSSNYGTATSLWVQKDTGGTYANHTWLKFSGLAVKNHFDGLYGAGNWVVNSVTLTMQTIGLSPYGWEKAGNHGVYHNSNSAWAETSLTWNNEGSYTNSSTRTNLGLLYAPLTTGTWVTSGNLIAPVLSNDILAGGDFTLLLWNDDLTTNIGARRFNSREWSTGKPYITVQAEVIPEPGTLVALGSGLVAMAGFVIRRKK
ncbi:MAG: DNRLRE domain-containing protein [Armatimonadota bacterium]